MPKSTSSKHELNALKLEVMHCTEQILELRGEFNELKREACAASLIEK